jgi:hypothetical protein
MCPGGPAQHRHAQVENCLAHALEFPGKLRLKKEQYLAVQPIYYPGFTIGGIAEPAVILATLALLITTPAGTAAF